MQGCLPIERPVAAISLDYNYTNYCRWYAARLALGELDRVLALHWRPLGESPDAPKVATMKYNWTDWGLNAIQNALLHQLNATAVELEDWIDAIEQRVSLKKVPYEPVPLHLYNEFASAVSALDSEIAKLATELLSEPEPERLRLAHNDRERDIVVSANENHDNLGIQGRIRKAIGECGSNAKPETVLRKAGVADSQGRKELRKLEERGEFNFARKRPARYR